MGVHFAWNAVQGPLLGIVVSGSSAGGTGLIRSTMNGPEWLSSGAFGAEASAVTIVLLTAVGVFLMVEVGRRGLAVQPTWVRRRVLLARAGTAAVPSQMTSGQTSEALAGAPTQDPAELDAQTT